jgi:hypothetical protein
MTLSDIASLGSLVSGIAVLISLVYLSLQVKQSERNQQAAIRQGRIGRVVDIMLAAAEPSISEAFVKATRGSDDISAVQLNQFMICTRASFFNIEDGFYQHKDGLLNDSAFDNMVVAIRSMFASPSHRVAWKSLTIHFDAEFVAFMDKLLAEASVRPPGDALAKFKIDFVAEQALAAR